MLDSGITTCPPCAANSPYASLAVAAARAAAQANGRIAVKKVRELMISPALGFQDCPSSTRLLRLGDIPRAPRHLRGMIDGGALTAAARW
jgi:hypothetical protein